MAGHQDRCSKLPVPCEYCAVRIPRDEVSFSFAIVVAGLSSKFYQG